MPVESLNRTYNKGGISLCRRLAIHLSKNFRKLLLARDCCTSGEIFSCLLRPLVRSLAYMHCFVPFVLKTNLMNDKLVHINEYSWPPVQVFRDEFNIQTLTKLWPLKLKLTYFTGIQNSCTVVYTTKGKIPKISYLMIPTSLVLFTPNFAFDISWASLTLNGKITCTVCSVDPETKVVLGIIHHLLKCTAGKLIQLPLGRMESRKGL